MKGRILTVIMTVALMGAAQVSWAGEIDDLKAQIRELQKTVEALSKRQDNKISVLEEKLDEAVNNAQTIGSGNTGVDFEYVGRYNSPSKKGGLIVKNAFGFGNVTLGGYFDHEYQDFSNSDSFFDQHRWILNIGAELGERLRFFSEYEIEHGGPDAPVNGSAKVEQAYVDFLINDAINVRMGAFLAPFGRLNVLHDSDLRDTTTRPIVDRDVIPTTWTQAGVGFFGEFNPTLGNYEDLEINYEIYVENGLDNGMSETSFSGAKGSLRSDNNNNKGVTGRVAFSPGIGHEIGFSAHRSKYDNAGDLPVDGKAIDWLTTWGPLEFTGEWANFRVKPGSTPESDNYQGLRLETAYHFWPEFLDDTFLGRSFEDPTFTAIYRYGWAKIDDGPDADSIDNEETVHTIGFNYRPVESWVFKIEKIWSKATASKMEYGGEHGIVIGAAMAF